MKNEGKQIKEGQNRRSDQKKTSTYTDLIPGMMLTQAASLFSTRPLQKHQIQQVFHTKIKCDG